ncbi:BTAD domain-containing putative transcriptional regulator [Amycolatopsis sp. A133]|uniref:AfsR/SARP family transcriptional regulator n=1 Tax=Amycolatopsis sp. A133 TaxID=3064472 RepID=UPI0027EAA25B|nr:BTAD domain-containing putative transcriptional regulator [Amycolatopsis sp. A133]MDQ7810876.1 BTAD domain-containing putative transcriptional regulator [Amycolatopsis sp. A133]
MLRIDLLGEVRARVAGGEVAVGPPRQRAVLAVLALRAGETVSRAELVDGVWGDAAPASVEGSVHTYIHGLRRVLAAAGGDVLVRTGAGYRLVLEPAAVDVTAAEAGARRARELAAAGDHPGAVRVLGESLARWRGEPLFGLPGPLAEAERVRLTELRFQLVEERAELLLELGRHREVVGELGEAVQAEPFRERLRALLMLALYRGGRRADALAEFEATRRLFVAELGLDPGPELIELQARVLRADPGLDAPAASPSAPVPAQLPHGVPDFVGRTHELEQLAQWRATAGRDSRALVISAVDGFGGVGKTSLAVRFARQVAADFPDGQLYLNLRGFDPHRPPLSGPEALGQLLWSLGAGGKRQDRDAQVAIYRTLLSDKRVLILLDNAASAEQVRELLPGPSNSLVLITSRNRLSGLVVRDGAHRLTLGMLTEAEARDLLRALVGRARIDGEPGAAAELARLCGCLPLALRIAAEKISANAGTSLRDLVANLTAEQDRLDTLEAGDDEMSSVRAVFSWSYHSLDPEVARAFRYLGTLPGQDIGFAAAAALLDRPVEEAAALLTVLCEQNLLERAGDRYGFHDLVRVYAAELAERHDSTEDRATAARELLGWYLQAARSAFACFIPDHPLVAAGVPDDRYELPVFDSREAVYAWYAAEAPNTLPLIQRAAELGEHDIAWQLAFFTYNHYYATGLLTEWIQLLNAGLASAGEIDDPEPRARILMLLGIAYSRIGQNGLAVERLESGLALARAVRDPDLQIALLANLASALREMRRYDEGIRRAQEAVELATAAGRDFRTASCLDSLCELYVESGQPRRALEAGAAGLRAARASDTGLTEVNLLLNMAHAHRDLGETTTALREYETVLELCAKLGDRYHEALALLGIAELERRAGRRARARDRAQRALDIFVQLDGEEAGEAQAFLARLNAAAAS